MIFGNLISGAKLDQGETRLGPKIQEVEVETANMEQQQQQQQKKQLVDWQLGCKYTLSEVQQHCSLDDCWMVIFDKVYNITEFVYEHPGGDFILLEYAGRDATHPFLSSRHGSSAYKMMDKYWIGILVDEELYYSNNSSYCSVYSNLSWRSTPTLEDQSSTVSSTQVTPPSSNGTTATSSELSSSNTTDIEEEIAIGATTTTTTLPEQDEALASDASVTDMSEGMGSIIIEDQVHTDDHHHHHSHQHHHHHHHHLHHRQLYNYNKHHLSRNLRQQKNRRHRYQQQQQQQRNKVYHNHYHSSSEDEDEKEEKVAIKGKGSPIVFGTLHYFYRALTQR